MCAFTFSPMYVNRVSLLTVFFSFLQEMCASGREGNRNGTSCSDCTVGMYQPDSGTSFCLPCLPG